MTATLMKRMILGLIVGLIESDLMQGLGFGFIIDLACQTINAVVTGKYDPSLPLAFKLAQIFGQPIEAIFTPTVDIATG